MAVLVDADFVHIQQFIRSQPTLKAEFKGWALTKAVWRAGLQACEDYAVGAFSVRPAGSWRAAIEAQTGATTGARAQAVISAWAYWKNRSFLGG